MINTEQSFWSRLFGSKYFLIVLLFFVIFISYSVIRERRDQKVVRENINSLAVEIASLEGKSLELSSMIKYLRSDDYVEKEAREKLGLQKEGERLVIVPEGSDNLAKVAGDEDMSNMSNVRLWARYFFGSK
jgi:cell division protein DivIC